MTTEVRASMELSITEINREIYTIRNQKVILDDTLARYYGIETKVLKRAVRRNIERFPYDFLFELTESEIQTLKSQIGNIIKEKIHGGVRYFPFAFTESGVAMISSVLKSERAVQMNIAIMRAFTRLRQVLESTPELIERITQTERKTDQLETKINQILKGPKISTHLITSVQLGDVEKSSDLTIPPTVEKILKAVATFYQFKVNDLKKQSRSKTLVLSRQIAMYLIRKNTEMGLREIGTYFSGRDHTTVLHACHKIKTALRQDNKLRDTLENIQRTISS